jgi:type IV pilus assembly protein PilW
VSLVELMVGIAIGLLVVAVAMSALMVSRGVSGTVSDVSNIQQQAAYAMRVIGLQLRQAGSLYLNANPTNAVAGNEYMAAVAFETKAPASSASSNSFDPATDTLSSASGALTVGYRRYKDPVFTDAAAQSLARNCLGGPANSSDDQRVENIFQLNGTDLQCGGNGAVAQSIVQNIANFQVRYLLQDVTTTPGSPQIKYVNAAAVGTDWSKVQGVEVCLVLYGIEPIDMPAGSSYTDCDGTNAVNMTTLTGARASRIHMVFRNVYQLRSQGLM